jgi:hypothetical protein
MKKSLITRLLSLPSISPALLFSFSVSLSLSRRHPSMRPPPARPTRQPPPQCAPPLRRADAPARPVAVHAWRRDVVAGLVGGVVVAVAR